MSHDVHSPTPRLLLSLVSTALQSCGSCLVSYTLLPVLVIKVVNGVTFIDNRVVQFCSTSGAKSSKDWLDKLFWTVKTPLIQSLKIFASVHATELNAGILYPNGTDLTCHSNFSVVNKPKKMFVHSVWVHDKMSYLPANMYSHTSEQRHHVYAE